MKGWRLRVQGLCWAWGFEVVQPAACRPIEPDRELLLDAGEPALNPEKDVGFRVSGLRV